MAWEDLPKPLMDFLSTAWTQIEAHAVSTATAVFGTAFGSVIAWLKFRSEDRQRQKDAAAREVEVLTQRMSVLMQGYEHHVSALSGELSALREEACKLREEVYKLRKLLDHRTEMCKGCHHFEYVFGVNNAPQ